jgi:hypothetical protein
LPKKYRERDEDMLVILVVSLLVLVRFFLK